METETDICRTLIKRARRIPVIRQPHEGMVQHQRHRPRVRRRRPRLRIRLRGLEGQERVDLRIVRKRQHAGRIRHRPVRRQAVAARALAVRQRRREVRRVARQEPRQVHQHPPVRPRRRDLPRPQERRRKALLHGFRLRRPAGCRPVAPVLLLGHHLAADLPKPHDLARGRAPPVQPDRVRPQPRRQPGRIDEPHADAVRPGGGQGGQHLRGVLVDIEVQEARLRLQPGHAPLQRLRLGVPLGQHRPARQNGQSGKNREKSHGRPPDAQSPPH